MESVIQVQILDESVICFVLMLLEKAWIYLFYPASYG